MLKTLLIVISATVAALICGFSLITLAAASLTLCAVCWFNTLMILISPTWFVVNDPACFTPRLIGKALEEALTEALQSKKPLLVQISNPGVNPIRIEINSAGELKVGDSRHSFAVENPSRWIPDHPLPLLLKAGVRTTLTFNPVTDQRVRVSNTLPPLKHKLIYFLLPTLALLALLDINAAAAALVATLLHRALTLRFVD